MDLLKPLGAPASVDLSGKMFFSVSQNLLSNRRCEPGPPHAAVPPDPWSIKAPDFTPKLYRSLGLPRIKRKNALLLKSSDSLVDKPISLDRIYKKAPSTLPGLEQKRHKTQSFITHYKPADSLESMLLFVKTGKYPLGPYKDPKLHNFRPSAEGLPDIITSVEKDPGGLIFKSQNLRTVTASQPALNNSHRDTQTSQSKMDTFKPTELKWDPKLILPKTPWPPKSASYTRYRRRRSVYSALMDRVEEKLTNTWRT